MGKLKSDNATQSMFSPQPPPDICQTTQKRRRKQQRAPHHITQTASLLAQVQGGVVEHDPGQVHLIRTRAEDTDRRVSAIAVRVESHGAQDLCSRHIASLRSFYTKSRAECLDLYVQSNCGRL